MLFSPIKRTQTVPLTLLLAALLPGSVQSTSAQPPNWIGPSQMTQPRKEHTATLLPNGRVLVAGGVGNFPSLTILASAELFDPTTSTWVATHPMTVARFEHTATLLLDGRVLVAGGPDGAAELYDPTTETWQVTGSLTLHRDSAAHTATLLPSGKVLVAGGGGPDEIDKAELYDPAMGTWTATGSLNIGRAVHSATLLSNGKVLVVGGVGPDILSSAELYDPVAGTWTLTSPLSFARYRHTATLLFNGKVLVAGGQLIAESELYDPDTGSWTPTGSLVVARFGHSATLLSSGEVFTVGGWNGDFLTSAELYDSATGNWTETIPIPTSPFGRGFHTTTLMPNGMVLVAGGQGGIDGIFETSFLYDPGSGSEELSPVPNVVGLDQTSAESAILGADLTVGAVSTAHSSSVAVGDVISQNPVGGSQVVKGSAVDLVISEGPTLLPTPLNLVGRAKLSHVNLRWLPSAEATQYRVFRRLNFESTFSQKGLVVTTAFVDDIPSNGLFAEYYVIAENEFGRSEPSAPVTVAPTQR